MTSMFIVTARVPKKKLLIGAVTLSCCAVVVAAALLFSLGGRAVTASAEVSNIRSNDDRVAYLTGLGWQVSGEPVLTEELLIPDSFDESYTDYLALQSEQGFDLSRYCGKRVKRYIYQITNHPDGQDGIQAALLIYKNRIIGGQVQSADGTILHGLSVPAPTPTGSPAPGEQL